MEIGERHFSLDSQIEGTYLPIFWSTVVEFFILILMNEFTHYWKLVYINQLSIVWKNEQVDVAGFPDG